MANTKITTNVIADGAITSAKLDTSGLDFTGDIAFDTSTLVIDSTNNRVGVGTTGPDTTLHVNSGDITITNNSPSLYFDDSDVTNLSHRILGGGNAGLEYSADANNVGTGYHRFDIGGSEAMRLIEGASLGIGTSSPSAELHVKGNAQIARLESTSATGNNYLSYYDSSALKGHIGYTGSSDDDFNLYNAENSNVKVFTNGSERMRIASDAIMIVTGKPI